MAELGQNYFLRQFVTLMQYYRIYGFVYKVSKNATFQTIIAYHISVPRKARTQFIGKTLRFGTT